MVFVYSTATLKPLIVPFEPSNNQFFFFFSLSLCQFFLLFLCSHYPTTSCGQNLWSISLFRKQTKLNNCNSNTSTNRDQITSPRVAEPSNLISFTWKYPLTSLQLPPGLVPRVLVLLSYNFKIILIFASKQKDNMSRASIYVSRWSSGRVQVKKTVLCIYSN